ncbi:hypothetical protein BC829DRAFT_421474 [Chytridium lagenaria]|nr:hypothetical protein BC829DRAFT_421474 [Chytridium lagenaria]
MSVDEYLEKLEKRVLWVTGTVMQAFAMLYDVTVICHMLTNNGEYSVYKTSNNDNNPYVDIAYYQNELEERSHYRSDVVPQSKESRTQFEREKDSSFEGNFGTKSVLFKDSSLDEAFEESSPPPLINRRKPRLALPDFPANKAVPEVAQANKVVSAKEIVPTKVKECSAEIAFLHDPVKYSINIFHRKHIPKMLYIRHGFPTAFERVLQIKIEKLSHPNTCPSPVQVQVQVFSHTHAPTSGTKTFYVPLEGTSPIETPTIPSDTW